jgi:hypothetical protein
MPLECESYQFVKSDSFTYDIGCRDRAAVSHVLTKARQKAEQDAADATKDEKCKGPCERALYVEVKFDRKPVDITPVGAGFDVEVKGTWEAYILCYRLGETKKNK